MDPFYVFVVEMELFAKVCETVLRCTSGQNLSCLLNWGAWLLYSVVRSSDFCDYCEAVTTMSVVCLLACLNAFLGSFDLSVAFTAQEKFAKYNRQYRIFINDVIKTKIKYLKVYYHLAYYNEKVIYHQVYYNEKVTSHAGNLLKIVNNTFIYNCRVLSKKLALAVQRRV